MKRLLLFIALSIELLLSVCIFPPTSFATNFAYSNSGAVIRKMAPKEIIYTDTIVFDRLTPCNDVTSKKISIKNISPVDTLKLGAGSFAYAVPFHSAYVDNGTTAVIPPDSTYEIEILTTRSAPGEYVNEMTIPYSLGSDAGVLEIYLKGIIDDLIQAVTNSKIIFPPITDCQTSSSSYIYIKNLSDTEIDSIVPNSYSDMTFLNSQEYSKGIAPSDSFAFEVIYSPENPGDYSDDIYIDVYSKGCKKTLGIPFEASKMKFVVTLTDEIDFGTIFSCDTGKTIEKEFLLRVDAPIKCSLDRVALCGGFKDGGDYDLDLHANDDFSENVDNYYKFRFTPKRLGVFKGHIEIWIGPCKNTYRIYLTANVVEAKLAALQNNLDFGELDAGSQGQLSAKYVNYGGADLTINDIKTPGAPFSLNSTDPPLPCVIKPGDTLKIEFGMVGKTPGAFSDSSVISASPCDITQTIYLSGAIKKNVLPSATVMVGEVAGKADETVVVPISLKIGGNVSPSNRRYRAQLAFNKTLLIPKFQEKSDSVGERLRYCTIEGETPIKDTIIYRLPFAAALGNSVSTPIELVKFDWLDELEIETFIKDGTFTLTDVCREGGPRLFQAGGAFEAPIVRPNPTSGEVVIAFNPIEGGMTKLTLFDANGNVIRELYEGEPKIGPNTITTDLSDTPVGVYYVGLATPTQRFFRKLVLIK